MFFSPENNKICCRIIWQVRVFCFLIFRHRVHCNKKHRTTFQNRRPNWSYFCPCIWGCAKSFPITNSIGKIWHDIFGNSRQKSTILFRWPRVWTFQTIFTFLQKKTQIMISLERAMYFFLTEKPFSPKEWAIEMIFFNRI